MTLFEVMATIEDPRCLKWVYPLTSFLPDFFLAVTSGANSTRTVAAFLRIRYDQLNELVGLNCKPDRLIVHGTVHNILRHLSSEAIAKTRAGQWRRDVLTQRAKRWTASRLRV